MRLAVFGSLRTHLRAEAKIARKAMIQTLREAARDLTAELKADTSRGLGRRVGRKWKFRVFSNGRRTADMAALIYPAGGPRLRQMLGAHEKGAVIRAQNGRYLAIPTLFNRAGGRRGGKVLFQPRELHESFVQRSRNGNLLIFAPVRQAQRLRRGQVQSLAVASNQVLGSGRRKRTEALLAARAVPMFVLKRFVRVPGGRLRTSQIVERIGAGLPVRFVEIATRNESAGDA